MKAAIGDAAFMTAMERNSDIVTMQCYAPLFVNVNERQWRPNLIGYDALTSYGSPSYYALAHVQHERRRRDPESNALPRIGRALLRHEGSEIRHDHHQTRQPEAGSAAR